MQPLTHGGDWAGYRAEFGRDPLDFSANVSPLGLPDGVAEAITASLATADRYPDPLCRALRAKLAVAENVPAESLLCGNGAADLIFRLVLAAKPRTALVTAPTFAEYATALETVGCTVERHFLREENDFAVTEDILNAVHPTFLYESIWCLVGFAVLASLYKKRRFNGQIFLGYIIWYGLGRAWIEGLRTDSLLIGNTGLRASQLVAIGSVIVAAALMVIGLRNAKGKPLMVPLAVKDLKKQAEAGDRFTPDTLPAGAPHAEFVKATDAMNARLDALDLSEVEIEEIEDPKE